jgi:hypothetical protein
VRASPTSVMTYGASSAYPEPGPPMTMLRRRDRVLEGALISQATI